MAHSTRKDPKQQFKKAPTTNKIYLLASDPTNEGKYDHKELSELGLGGGTGTFIPPSVVPGEIYSVNLLEKEFTIMRPSGKSVGVVLVFFNMAFLNNASYTLQHNQATVDITVTGYNAIEGDSITLIIFWE